MNDDRNSTPVQDGATNGADQSCSSVQDGGDNRAGKPTLDYHALAAGPRGAVVHEPGAPEPTIVQNRADIDPEYERLAKLDARCFV
jgi:hypothetical protein